MWIQTCKGDAEFRDAFGDSVSCTGVSKDQGQTIEALVLTDESAQLLVEAGNAHEQTGMTPARLAEDLAAAQQEIARLRAALVASLDLLNQNLPLHATDVVMGALLK